MSVEAEPEKPQKLPRKIGAPLLPFDQEIANEICEQLIEGKSLRSILNTTAGYPASSTIYKWLIAYPAFAEQYSRAREAQADALFDETLDIADDSENDWIERKHFAGDDASPQLNGEAVARARLRIDTRKWMAGKLKPKKYGEKLDIDQTLGVSTDLAALLNRTAITGQRLIASDAEEKDE